MNLPFTFNNYLRRRQAMSDTVGLRRYAPIALLPAFAHPELVEGQRTGRMKTLLLLIASISCAPLLGIDNKIIPITMNNTTQPTPPPYIESVPHPFINPVAKEQHQSPVTKGNCLNKDTLRHLCCLPVTLTFDAVCCTGFFCNVFIPSQTPQPLFFPFTMSVLGDLGARSCEQQCINATRYLSQQNQHCCTSCAEEHPALENSCGTCYTYTKTTAKILLGCMYGAANCATLGCFADEYKH